MIFPETFNPSFAFITHGNRVFQVLNEDGTDWDEELTAIDYRSWLDSL